MGKRDYAISTSLTGDSGEAFLAALSESQRREITALPGLQRKDLEEVAAVRRNIAGELRRFLAVGDGQPGQSPGLVPALRGSWMGEMSFLQAVAFARVGQSLTAQQKERLARMRQEDPSAPKGPFLYSAPAKGLKVEGSEAFFGG